MDSATILFMERFWVVLGSPWTPWFCLAVFLAGHEVWRLKRDKREVKESRINSWFPHHFPRQVYHTVLLYQIREVQKLNPESQYEIAALPSSKELLSIHNAALLRWAVECLRRALQLKGQAEACKKLVMACTVGRSLMEWMAVAEKEVEADMKNIIAFAGGIDPEFGENIMALAYNIMEKEDLDKKLSVIEKRREEEKEWWEARRQMILRELVAEFGEDDLGGVPQKLLANAGEVQGKGNGYSKTKKKKGSMIKAKAKGKK